MQLSLNFSMRKRSCKGVQPLIWLVISLASWKCGPQRSINSISDLINYCVVTLQRVSMDGNGDICIYFGYHTWYILILGHVCMERRLQCILLEILEKNGDPEMKVLLQIEHCLSFFIISCPIQFHLSGPVFAVICSTSIFQVLSAWMLQ